MSGKLGTSDLPATTITDVYTVPATTLSSVNISICNRSAVDVTIRLAISSTTGVQANDEFLNYDAILSKGCVLERTGIVMGVGEIVTMYADLTGISVVVTGIEETI